MRMGPDASTRDLAVLGGTGFLGRHFVAAAIRQGRRVRMLVRGAETETGVRADLDDSIARITGDLRDAAALRRLITPGATVVNFAWSGAASPDDAVHQAQQLAVACRDAGAAALLHCSTASVFGGCDAAIIRDETPPRPANHYGRVKLAVDEMFQRELEGRVPLALMRPASVFGLGGIALVKQIDEMLSGGGAASYLRSCLFDHRLMHFVPVETVVAAFLFIEPRVGFSGSRHLIAADDEPLNRYRALERHLRRFLGVPDHPWPRLPLPPAALRLALRAGGRSSALPFTPFDGDGLRGLGFKPSIAFEAAVESFATWYRARKAAA